jgi:hypothetical protein
MNHYNTAMTATGFIILSMLGGCAATTTPQTDARFGEAVTLLQAQQTLDPQASANTNPVTGMDGKAAKGALDNYRDSFRKPPAEASGPAVSITSK